MTDSEIREVAAVLRGAHSVFIAAHIMPDGDCIGSQLALGHALRALGIPVTFSVDDKVPESLGFLAGVSEIARLEPGNQEVFVYVDGSDTKRYGKALNLDKTVNHPVILIDHHTTNEPFGTYNLVDIRAASTAEIVYRVILALDVTITPAIAQALLTGLVTDTLGFRTNGTTPETLETAVALLRHGGSIPQIIDHVYNRRAYSSLRVLGHAAVESHLGGGIIWSAVDYKTLQSLGSNGSGTSGIVNLLLTVGDARVAFFLAEREDGRIDLSLRSRADVDVSGVATRLGGGGHKQASGAVLAPPFNTAAPRVLDAIRQELGLRQP